MGKFKQLESALKTPLKGELQSGARTTLGGDKAPPGDTPNEDGGDMMPYRP